MRYDTFCRLIENFGTLIFVPTLEAHISAMEAYSPFSFEILCALTIVNYEGHSPLMTLILNKVKVNLGKTQNADTKLCA